MEQIELFSIDKFKCNSEAKYYLNIIEGEWHPQDLNDSPLKFILSTSDLFLLHLQIYKYRTQTTHII